MWKLLTKTFFCKKDGNSGPFVTWKWANDQIFFSETFNRNNLNWNLNETAHDETHTMFFVAAGQSDGSNFI